MKIYRRLLRLKDSKSGVSVDWHDDEQAVMLMVFTGEWDWQHTLRAFVKLLHLIRRRDMPFGLILDFTPSARIPHDVWLVGRNNEWIWSPALWPKSVQRIVIVGGGAVMDEIMKIRRRIAPESISYFKQADSLEAALHVLETWSLDE